MLIIPLMIYLNNETFCRCILIIHSIQSYLLMITVFNDTLSFSSHSFPSYLSLFLFHLLWLSFLPFLFVSCEATDVYISKFGLSPSLLPSTCHSCHSSHTWIFYVADKEKKCFWDWIEWQWARHYYRAPSATCLILQEKQ